LHITKEKRKWIIHVDKDIHYYYYLKKERKKDIFYILLRARVEL
jgi:hypothetical protein